MTPRVTDLQSPPIVGQRYYVYCVYVEKSPLTINIFEESWAPTLGPLHDDREIIGTPGEHWHIDWRFAPEWSMECSEKGRFFGRVAWKRRVKREPQWKLLKCLRLMPEFPILIGGEYEDDPSEVQWLARLETAYADAKISKCGKCPHRGIPLVGVPVVNGVRVCPGHGLAFSESGSMVRRVTEAR